MFHNSPMLGCRENVEPEDIQGLLDEHGVLYGTDKEDGIRCIAGGAEGEWGNVALSRKFIHIPNSTIQDFFDTCHSVYTGLDGEIVIEGRRFDEIESWVMSHHGAPVPWKYVVFDYMPQTTAEKRLGYLQRLQILRKNYRFHPKIEWYLNPVELRSKGAVLAAFDSAVERGKEGLILRTGDGPYKFGRSTWNEGWMLKMKQFEEREAVCLGMVEQNQNINEKELDAFGKTKRSKKKAGLIPKGILGAIVGRDILTGVIFKVGSGWDQDQAKEWWERQDELTEELFTYRCHKHGVKNKPRNASFKAWRSFE